MDNYFDEELLRMERELTRLKTARLKSAGVICTVAQSKSLSIPLALNASGFYANGEKMYRIITDSDELIIPTIDWYYADMDNPGDTRMAHCELGRTSAGIIILRVVVIGDMSDVFKLRNGQSVSLSVNLSVRCTGQFELEDHP